ncbi:aldo/keto reductase [Wenjunlia tyrosinilytica]|uniref:NADP-dependent aryl-alcohol dehydrogenase n=1 Tax=Wenjunlia tyrosinilytica TaxID=1544741 RepID=A0A918DXI5_9ACTN|nr:aldo/keto reductase [Wenjunlia tyrosinilytica]GGO86636.1 NADP-dependent aryl-alcohol dehydrogenase [Wenjunlia tyrosinilytica]
MNRIGTSDLEVFPLSLGGNVFGWTADEAQSFAILDAYAAAGGNFVDTADAYSAWAPGNSGGESEEIIGRWLAARGNRDDIVVATKVGGHPKLRGLAPATIKKGVEGSLRRLGVDHIDLYYAHYDDPGTPVEETLRAFNDLVTEGKVRCIGASNFTGARLSESLAVSEREGLARYVAVQPHYNLVFREEYERGLRDVAAANGLSAAPYYGLASGFLTGKYRTDTDVDSARAGGAAKYLDSDRGRRVLAALDEVAAEHGVAVGTVALAWLRSQPTVAAPIASARTADQLPPLLASVDLELAKEDLRRLEAASQ